MARIFGVALVAVLFMPAGVSAQQSGAIAGVVRDATGAVMPGVSVEASSPALIEKVRSVTTDGNGQYRIVDLFPGVYSVTFTLAGFSTVRREGIELTAGFTANVAVELRVGSLEETITVSGASPVVDTQNVSQRRVMTRDVIEAIPTSKQYTAMAQLVPGVATTAPGGPISHDVGGITGMTHVNVSFHGSRAEDGAPRVNGMTVASITSQGNSRSNLQDATVEEVSMQLSGSPAEFPYGGVYFNLIPKQGGNRYQGSMSFAITGEALHDNNLDDELRSQGLTAQNELKQLLDINPAFGGPIVQDRLWFFAGGRYNVTDSYVPGLLVNKDETAWVYEPDPTRQAVNDQYSKATSLNLTWNANPKNKFTAFYSYDFGCWCHYGINAALSPEAAHNMKGKNSLYQGTWSSPVTSRLLVEAAASRYDTELPRDPQPVGEDQGAALAISILEQARGIRYRSGAGYARNGGILDHYRAAMTYVTGSHSLKVGFEHERQFAHDKDQLIGSRHYRVLNGVPNQVTYTTRPYEWQSHMNPLGLYVQDQWTVNRWTLNLGLRYDQFKSSYPESYNPPTEFLPVPRLYPGADVFDWKDLNPRLAVAWDVFGTGRTAIKASVNRYIQQEGKLLTNAIHPVFAAVNSVARTWRDLNGNLEVDGDPFNPAAQPELGPSPAVAFGSPITTLTYDPDWASGFGQRPYNWETVVSAQHELLPGVSLNGAYYRRNYGNHTVTNNVAVSPSEYDPYCITAPLDPRLPRGGGYQICGLYDINPSALGRVQDFTTRASTYGDMYETYNGGDVTINARLPRGVLLQGGLATGKQVRDRCDLVGKAGDPTSWQCHVETPYLTQLKFLGSYPLPWQGLQVSGTFVRQKYDPTGAFRPTDIGVLGMRAFYVATNAEIAPSLGRSLAAGVGSTVSIDLLDTNPGLYFDPVNVLDARLSKTFTFGPRKLQANFDVYNVFNDNTPMRFNTSYGRDGANWLVPQAAIPGRLIRISANLTF